MKMFWYSLDPATRTLCELAFWVGSIAFVWSS